MLSLSTMIRRVFHCSREHLSREHSNSSGIHPRPRQTSWSGGGELCSRPHGSTSRCQQELTPAVAAALEDRTTLLERFLHLQPPTFYNDYDPDQAESWVHELECTFETMDCAEQDQLTVAQYHQSGSGQSYRIGKGVSVPAATGKRFDEVYPVPASFWQPRECVFVFFFGYRRCWPDLEDEEIPPSTEGSDVSGYRLLKATRWLSRFGWERDKHVVAFSPRTTICSFVILLSGQLRQMSTTDRMKATSQMSRSWCQVCDDDTWRFRWSGLTMTLGSRQNNWLLPLFRRFFSSSDPLCVFSSVGELVRCRSGCERWGFSYSVWCSPLASLALLRGGDPLLRRVGGSWLVDGAFVELGARRRWPCTREDPNKLALIFEVATGKVSPSGGDSPWVAFSDREWFGDLFGVFLMLRLCFLAPVLFLAQSYSSLSPGVWNLCACPLKGCYHYLDHQSLRTCCGSSPGGGQARVTYSGSRGENGETSQQYPPRQAEEMGP
ncbi:hypothetical protein Taro_026171 [Colocasia esculenta]|uniref:Uncharacterized protein n=1 Tax=Colocasia esculenta TaxID=4460 RepID=A0A843VQJ7_COLES|nr:hypothetical protein [Colocasia esculenta]